MTRTLMTIASLIAVSLMLTGCGGGGTPESAAERFMKALEKADLDAVMDMGPPDELLGENAEALKYGRAANMLEEIHSNEGILDFEINEAEEEDIVGSYAELTAEVTYHREEEVTNDEGETNDENIERNYRLTLTKYQGRWFVADVAMNAR